jgi:hypothetical protein
MVKAIMRPMSIGMIVGASALAASAHLALAQNQPSNAALLAILAPQPGNKACYARRYDAAHLRQHPRQRITAMTFRLAVEAYDPPSEKAERSEDKVYYTFSMTVNRRGDKRRLYTAGDCNGGDEILCAVDCDGGSVTLDKMPPADTLIVRLDDNGIVMFHDCDEGEGIPVKAGADDKVFRLSKAADNLCWDPNSEPETGD